MPIGARPMGHFQPHPNAFLAMDDEARRDLLAKWTAYIMATPDVPQSREMLAAILDYSLRALIETAKTLVERHPDPHNIAFTASDITALPRTLRDLGSHALMAADVMEEIYNGPQD